MQRTGYVSRNENENQPARVLKNSLVIADFLTFQPVFYQPKREFPSTLARQGTHLNHG
jgi:hypothetical protein